MSYIYQNIHLGKLQYIHPRWQRPQVPNPAPSLLEKPRE